MQTPYARLDNPVWHAIADRHSHLGRQSRLSCCYQAQVSPFAAVMEPSTQALRDLSELIAPGSSAIVKSLSLLPAESSWQSTVLGSVIQMIATHAPSPGSDEGIRRLGTADVEHMMELVEATRPGPFERRTLEMGSYIGIQDKGRLIAMAGERMRLTGFVEISAVCVDDSYRGQGLAVRVINTLRREILGRGEVPFLHVLSTNSQAISIYEHLGFEHRQTFRLNKLERNRQ